MCMDKYAQHIRLHTQVKEETAIYFHRTPGHLQFRRNIQEEIIIGNMIIEHLEQVQGGT